MRVLLVHNRYQQRGGEDTVVETELEQLRAGGVEADLHCVTNDEITGLFDRLRTFTGIQDRAGAADAVVERARAFRADVVHVHNFFPLLTPGVHKRLHAAGFPVVQTLHNYRLLCANAMFLREERICEDCVTGTRLNALRHRCYRGSAIGSAAVLAMQNASIHDPSWHQSVTRFIALTEFQRNKLIAGGLPAEKVVVKGNSVPDPGAREDLDRQGALFVGRLASGKGLDVLLDAWAGIDDISLTIVGDGPDEQRARARGPGSVRFMGKLDRQEVAEQMRRARFLILPSTWYEGFPMTLVEAFSCGLPVVASRIGGIPEIVTEGKTGFLFEPGDAISLRAAVRAAFAAGNDHALLSNQARRCYEDHYSQGVNFAALTAIYRDAISGVPGRVGEG